MTQKEIKKLEQRSDSLYSTIRRSLKGATGVGSLTLDLINEYVEVQLLLEAECNK